MRKEAPEPKMLIAEGLVCIPRELSESGEKQAVIMHGSFAQNEFRTILRRRIERKYHPFIEIHDFEEKIIIITPQLQEKIRLADRTTKNEFLDQMSYEMFDAKKVIIKS